ncbi:hypothetical protein ACJRO7_022170 [Eucalyptus globulus]|uniref:TIR domain-containing protein n=1 Tax=Eucalyptus globulus TaxID=34317 RepID=A0ABD3KPM8_EUCGL
MDISGQLGKKPMDSSHVTNPSSSVSTQQDYEVFLSSRGQEMHRVFADFLYTSLTDVGIHVFRNEEELETGEEIDPQLIQTIEQCKISIPVISMDYALSKSCLPELDQMVESMDKKNSIIIPVFYYVEPSDVRDHRGLFANAPVEHVGDLHSFNRWWYALRRIGKLEGHLLHEKNEGSHGKVVKRIVHEVQQKLKKRDLIVPEQLVGLHPHVQEIMAKLKVDYRNGQAIEIEATCVKVLGIYGIPGVGKTVLAKHVYNQLYHLVDACCFLGEIQAEINSHGIVSVQNKLISELSEGNAKKFDRSEEALSHIRKIFCTMKILVLLDDVYNNEQLGALVGGLNGLCLGSRVILTSQTQDVLRNINGAESFFLEPMKQDQALKLFCRHAFGTDSPCEEFEYLSTDIVAATGRLPLALEVTGSSLFLVKSKKAWRETLTALDVSPQKRVQAALEKSYADLDMNARQIFLDIACLFTGMDKRIPYYMWDDCNYSPSRTIPALQARSLVKIGEDKKLLMHDILKKFGREIVKNENRYEPSERSRLWNHEEALSVLTRGKGTEKVKALRLEIGDGFRQNILFQCDQFDGLQNLRFLKLDQADIRGNFGVCLSNVRWLDWRGCPKIFDDQSLNLNVQNLLILDLSWSQVDQGWRGWDLLVEARNLKVLKLTCCVQLTSTPTFPASMELERLNLEGCSNLAVIDPSFGNLTKLVSLNMKGCSLLGDLLILGPMRSLKELVIDGTSISQINFQGDSMRKLKFLSARNCKNLTKISNSISYLKSLTYLSLDGSKIKTLVESIGSLEKLKTLSLKNCQRLTDLPDGIGRLSSLQLLDLSDTAIQKLPTSVEDLKATKVLWVRRTFTHEEEEEEEEQRDFSSYRGWRG